MPSPSVDAVVFDLGGVLADVAGVARMRALASVDSDEEVWQRWLTCEWVRRFERGSCSPDDFAAGVVAEWELAIAPEEFLTEFRGWLVGPLPGATELVVEVRRHVPVALLSNTNGVHWKAGADRWPLLREFDQTFLSFELGLVKPDPEVFEHVVTRLGRPRDRLLFLDDNDLNVDAARAVGLQAQRVRGVDEARAALTAIGLIS
jgi:HAD superfamily hydrolase (TIGR01509 family)